MQQPCQSLLQKCKHRVRIAVNFAVKAGFNCFGWCLVALVEGVEGGVFAVGGFECYCTRLEEFLPGEGEPLLTPRCSLRNRERFLAPPSQ